MLFNLQTPLIKIPGIGPKTSAILIKNQLKTLENLLYFFPKDYLVFQPTTLAQAPLDQPIILEGTIKNINQRRKGHLSFQTATFSDGTGSIQLRWFNQPYLLRSLKPNQTYCLKGRIELFHHQAQIVNPKLSPPQTNHNLIEPIYPQLQTLKNSWFQRTFNRLFKLDFKISENLPQTVLKQHQLISRSKALKFIHKPSNPTQINQAKKRLAFEELFLLQRENLKHQTQPRLNAKPLLIENSHLQKFIQSLPFKPTASQLKAFNDLKNDLGQPLAMNRLLIGDVGSGKTIVATFAAYLTAKNKQLTYVMAPTQVLAEQLFHTFKQFLEPHHIEIELITNKHKPKHAYQVLVGTQALLFKKPEPNLGLVIIDEQHKFGVEQRRQLAKIQPHPHQLIMTATPIPRTLALTLMSHLDISYLQEKPANRLPVKTYLVPEIKRSSAYQWIKQKISQENYQVFVVAPLIEDSDNRQFQHLKSATQIYQNLQNIFHPFKLGLLHGQLKADEKTRLITDFSKGKIKILVSTTVIEVGLDIPQANIILIESAERFGLAQLHQLRGRVGRSHQQAYCLLFPGKLTPKAKQRLEALTKYQDGPTLAKLDMQLRGPGEIWGTRQHGFFNLRFANIFDEQLVNQTLLAAKQSLTSLDLSSQPA